MALVSIFQLVFVLNRLQTFWNITMHRVFAHQILLLTLVVSLGCIRQSSSQTNLSQRINIEKSKAAIILMLKSKDFIQNFGGERFVTDHVISDQGLQRLEGLKPLDASVRFEIGNWIVIKDDGLAHGDYSIGSTKFFVFAKIEVLDDGSHISKFRSYSYAHVNIKHK